jgi:hypothetical protein
MQQHLDTDTEVAVPNVTDMSWDAMQQHLDTDTEVEQVISSGPNVPAPDDRRIWSIGRMVTGRAKPKCLKNNMIQRPCLSTMNPMWLESAQQWWGSGDWSPELCHALDRAYLWQSAAILVGCCLSCSWSAPCVCTERLLSQYHDSAQTNLCEKSRHDSNILCVMCKHWSAVILGVPY